MFYRPTKEQYPLMESMAVAVAVDRDQGFVKSGNGYYDHELEKAVEDNRTVALRTLRVMNGNVNSKDQDGNEVHIVVPTDEDRERAQEIVNYFDQVLLMDKLGDNLVKRGTDGTVNDYNLQLSKLFDKKTIDVNKELAMIVSLPNSRRIADKRDQMNEFFSKHKDKGYISEVKQRVKVNGRVVDVKYIPRHSIHLATIVTADEKIGRFFMNDKLSDLAKSINGKDVTFVGTVKKQEINPHTGCQETVFNRVKFDQ